MKFVISYSCGKDSTLALHKMLEQGHNPVGLLVMINKEKQKSWFHGVDLELLDSISDSLDIPLIKCESSGEEYQICFENALKEAKEKGAEACVFGDIDIEDHRTWCTNRCVATDMKAIFPLWQRNRKENTMEAINLGYRCVIKCVNNKYLSQEFLGKVLDEDMVNYMVDKNIDACGENGEYHTITLGGPIFYKEIPYICEKVIDFGDVSAINILKSRKKSKKRI